MEQHVLWTSWNTIGLESLRLVQQNNEILAQSIIIGIKNNIPFEARYEIHCDPSWKVKQLSLELLNSSSKFIKIQADEAGKWTDTSGNIIASLMGCLDVDISATPFTNTLAIRRMALNPGQSSELTVAYIAVPEMDLSQSSNATPV